MLELAMKLGIALLIVGSLVEVVLDVGDRASPTFLPAPLSGLPPTDVATALGGGGFAILLLGVAGRMATGPLPGGHLLIGLIATVAFLFAGGFVVGEA